MTLKERKNTKAFAKIGRGKFHTLRSASWPWYRPVAEA